MDYVGHYFTFVFYFLKRVGAFMMLSQNVYLLQYMLGQVLKRNRVQASREREGGYSVRGRGNNNVIER